MKRKKTKRVPKMPAPAVGWAKLRKQARRGHRGYPIGTISFYGKDDQQACKVAAGAIHGAGGPPDALERWWSDIDVRRDPEIGRRVADFMLAHGVRTVAMADRIIGCPHEEGIDYPEGEACPQCPFWAGRDRWTGKLLQ